jgi:hypothetical protein
VTTYLATTFDDATFPFCSAICRAAHRTAMPGRKYREDDRYEFDEQCATCGVEFLARALTAGEASQRLMALYEPGVRS